MARLPSVVSAGVVIVGLSALLTTCAQVRLLTYPDRFVWLDQQKVSSVMYAMAGSMNRLDELVGDGAVSAERQSAILDELDRLEQQAS